MEEALSLVREEVIEEALSVLMEDEMD